MTDPVSHPDHYTAGGIETIDILKAKLTPEQFEGFLLGNILKYLTRARHKNGVEDLKKARWYLERLIGLTSNSGWKFHCEEHGFGGDVPCPTCATLEAV